MCHSTSETTSEPLLRDLSLAGRVVVTDKSGKNFTSRLVNLKRPLLRIPSLAIHLDRTVNDSFKVCHFQIAYLAKALTQSAILVQPRDSVYPNFGTTFFSAQRVFQGVRREDKDKRTAWIKCANEPPYMLIGVVG